MHAPTRSRGARRKARTEAAILEAAEELFLERGFRETRIDDVAEAADVAVGSIYSHFGSKLRLYLAIVDRALHDQERVFGEVHDQPTPPGERLTALAAAYVEFAISSPGRFQLLHEAAHIARDPGDEAATPKIVELAERGAALVEDLTGLLEEGIAAGELRPVDPQRTALYLFASWSGVLGLHLRRDRLGAPTRAELRSIVEAGIDIVRNGIRVEAPAALPAPPAT